MASVASDVYDLAYPSPISLEDLSAIAVATKVWRSCVNEHIIDNTLETFCDTYDDYIYIEFDKIPDTHWPVKRKIEDYLDEIFFTTKDWLMFHFEHIFRYHPHRRTREDILYNFDDIVCDYDGSIHYVRTAKRMLRCDGVTQYEKFMIACVYSFEDSIREMWPTIRDGFEEWFATVTVRRPGPPSPDFMLNFIQPDASVCPHLYYWINTVDSRYWTPDCDRMFFEDYSILWYTKIKCLSSFVYFWNRSSLKNQAIHFFSIEKDVKYCCRFLLQKMCKQPHLAYFLSEKGVNFMFHVWSTCDKIYVLSAWFCIKDKINETYFISFIVKLLSKKNDFFNKDEKLETCNEIWSSARKCLKESAIKVIFLSDESVLKKYTEVSSTPYQNTEFLMMMLKDATLPQRNTFWKNNWIKVLTSKFPVDLSKIMELCFSNEIEMNQFKNITMAKFENLTKVENLLSELGHFERLGEIINFCCADENTSRNLKKQFLQLARQDFTLSRIDISNPNSLVKLINDAYSDDAQQGIDFCREILTSIYIKWGLQSYIDGGDFFKVQRFVESFESNGHNLDELKQSFAEHLKELVMDDKWEMEASDIRRYLLWCLGGEDQVSEFRRSIDPYEIREAMLEEKDYRNEAFYPIYRYPDNFKSFLVWYYGLPDLVNDFLRSHPRFYCYDDDYYDSNDSAELNHNDEFGDSD